MSLDDVELMRGLLEKLENGEITEEQLEDAIDNVKKGAGGSGIKDVDDLLKRLGYGSGSGGGGGAAVKSVDYESAKHHGPTAGPASRSGVRVGNASADHVEGADVVVDLEGYVDQRLVIVVTEVPVKVLAPADVTRKGETCQQQRYKVKQSVVFRHEVPDVSNFVIEAGTVMRATFCGAE